MNEKFFQLPKEKQEAIINAGFRVFSQNTYKHSPVSEIAEAAGISKSLLFHYFHNKKELYLFLWEHCAQITFEFLEKYDCYGSDNLFDCMERGMMAKLRVMELYPDVGNFAIKAFYEKDPEIRTAIQESYQKHLNRKARQSLRGLDPNQFIPGLDMEMMYRDMYWASEGYLWELIQKGNVNVETMFRDFQKMIDFWKSIYLRKEQI